MHLKNLNNSYARCITRDLYEKTPKAVFAAMAVSFCVMTGAEESFENMDARLLDEWRALHGSGIVPQKPPKGPTMEAK